VVYCEHHQRVSEPGDGVNSRSVTLGQFFFFTFDEASGFGVCRRDDFQVVFNAASSSLRESSRVFS
jgi:hypothetical protein